MTPSDSFEDLFPAGTLSNVFPSSENNDIPGRDDLDTCQETSTDSRKIWRISELLYHLNDTLYMEYGKIWIEGEIAGLSRPASGHYYFTLKDDKTCLKTVLFKNQAAELAFPLAEGQKVLCLGRLNVYTARGDLQVVAERLEPWGEGRLRIAFEELKNRLAAEGLFSLEHKLSLPEYPENIFVISSVSGAAVRDFIKTARGRFACANIIVCPSLVQGEQAPAELIQALDLAESRAGKNDVIVITRGGGSLEDLWAFNNEDFIRRIHDCSVPVVSAVGHEVDITLCDLVADVRAATPTAAAHAVLPSSQEILQHISSLGDRLTIAYQRRILYLRQQLDILRHALKDPERDLAEKKLLLDEMERRATASISNIIERLSARHSYLSRRLVQASPLRLTASRSRELENLAWRLRTGVSALINARRAWLAALSGRLDTVSPLACLARGYSLVYANKDGELIRDAEQVRRHDRVRIVPAKGEILCEVIDVNTDKIHKHD